MRWVKMQLIPNLPERSVLVVDNVTSEKNPTTAMSKKSMIDWLTERNINFNEKITKPELYEIIKRHKQKNLPYVLDAELCKYDHRVLRLPPYHPELNPIEKIWALVKNWVASRNMNFTFTEVEKLTRQRFDEITAEDWQRICDHVDKVVEEYMEKERMFDEVSDEFRFVVSDETSEEEWSSDDEAGDSSFDIEGIKPL